MFGADFAFAYKGWSAQAEFHYIRMFPTGQSVSFLNGQDLGTNYFNTSGLMYQINYYHKPLRSVLAVRYDRLIANDLSGTRPANDYYGLPDALDFSKETANLATQENLSVSYVYLVRGLSTCIRVDYRIRLRKDLENYRRAADQLRIAYQYAF
jgi:hypothetical protein